MGRESGPGMRSRPRITGELRLRIGRAEYCFGRCAVARSLAFASNRWTVPSSRQQCRKVLSCWSKAHVIESEIATWRNLSAAAPVEICSGLAPLVDRCRCRGTVCEWRIACVATCDHRTLQANSRAYRRSFGPVRARYTQWSERRVRCRRTLCDGVDVQTDAGSCGVGAGRSRH